MAREPRRLTAIVSADVAGYSRLMGTDESSTLARLKAHVRELIDPKIAEHGGRTVKTMGDGLLLEFPSVVDAVRCAVDMQRGMQERNASVPPESRIQFRTGINVGDIIIDGRRRRRFGDRAKLQRQVADRAIEWCGKVAAAMPTSSRAHYFLAMAYALDGDLEKARIEAAELRRLRPDLKFDAETMRAEERTPARKAYVENRAIPALRKAGLMD